MFLWISLMFHPLPPPPTVWRSHSKVLLLSPISFSTQFFVNFYLLIIFWHTTWGIFRFLSFVLGRSVLIWLTIPCRFWIPFNLHLQCPPVLDKGYSLMSFVFFKTLLFVCALKGFKMLPYCCLAVLLWYLISNFFFASFHQFYENAYNYKNPYKT